MAIGEDISPILRYVESSPNGTTWNVRDPAWCPVACYLRSINPVAIDVCEYGISVGSSHYRLREGHPLRRLIQMIDRRVGMTVTREQVLAAGRLILRLDKMASEEQLEADNRNRAALRMAQLAEWGW